MERSSANASQSSARADVAIVGAGIAGSLLALDLGRQGLDVVIVDQNAVYPPDFRCEKLTRDQIELMRGLGALECLERAELARRGFWSSTSMGLADRGLRYDHMVNAVRGEWPSRVRFIQARVADIAPDAQTPRVELETGQTISARLVVLASGPNEKLRARLGVERRMLRERQSVCIGFSIAPEDGARFGFETLIHQGERAGDGVAFASLFPMGGAMRVNLFVYHDPREPWTRAFRKDPLEAMLDLMPGLKPALGRAKALGPADIRIVDLYESRAHVLPGVVLVGDAFRSSCPATGMGVTRCMTDVGRLAHVHIPTWLASPGMGPDKIARFYADPEKRAVDAASTRRAQLGRLTATELGLPWRLRRWLSGQMRAMRRGGLSTVGARP